MESIRYSPNPVPERSGDLRRYINDELRKISSELEEVHYSFIEPDSITVVTGGTPVGTVTDVQTLNDGNVYQVPEVTGVPGFDIEFNFSNVQSVKGIVSHINYVGSATHDVILRLRDYSTPADNDFLLIPNSGYYGYRTVLIPESPQYSDNGDAQITLYHATSGNASHDIYIDYIAILGKRNARY